MISPLPDSPERSVNGDATEPESAIKGHDGGMPALITTETPLRHTRIVFNEQAADEKKLIHIKEEKPIRKFNLDQSEKPAMATHRDASNGTSFAMLQDLGETANFAPANYVQSTKNSLDAHIIHNQ